MCFASGAEGVAIGNDYGYSLTFARQLKAFGSPGDVALALSTSGSSANVLVAMSVARERERRMITATLTGSDGADLAGLCHPVLIGTIAE